MAFPPGFLDEIKSRLSLAQVVGRKVVWDPRKSNPGKGDYWAPCPFHQEKTASFHVEDRKGFYYCFGCQAKGDMVGFVKETENMSFLEAVELLAGEAGLQMPERDPKAQEKADARTELAAVMEEAVKFCRLQLKTARAAEARDYLIRRGLADDALSRFEIGFAPDSRTAMTEALRNKGIAPEKIVAAGLAIQPDDGGAPYDRFRGRIMFPIRDARGLCIAFGGRALNPDAKAKYLNSPETLLFDKGRALYHHGPAREAAGKAGGLIVAEGYMDVIALAMHGFDHSVAPLGTAITEDQLRLMWRMADEPIVALDGDKAGLRAADRLVDLAMPLLEPGKSLRFCILPDGQDPDDMLRSAGTAAFSKLTEGAMPLIDMFWRRETAATELDSPERRAKFDADLRAALKRIADPSVRNHYGAEIKTRRAALFRPDQPARGQSYGDQSYRGKGNWRSPRPAPVRDGTKSSALAQTDAAATRVREAVIVATAAAFPSVAAEYETALERVQIMTPGFDRLRNAILSHVHEATAEDAAQRETLAARIDADLGPEALIALFRDGAVKILPHLRPGTPEIEASRALDDILSRHNAAIGGQADIDEAAALLGSGEHPTIDYRLSQAQVARQNANALEDIDLEGDEDQAAKERLDALYRTVTSRPK